MQIPGFDIVEKLGEGGTGTVWRAFQLSLSRAVALKVMHPALAEDEALLGGLVGRARQAANIKHADLVQLLDVGATSDLSYFVMEYVAGPTLDQTVAERGAIAHGDALRIVRHVAEALETAWHVSRVAHLDLRPENLMLDEDGTVKVVDLGLSVLGVPGFLDACIRAGTVSVHPHFLSPEQARGDDALDCRSDIYSLGAVLYFMLTGQRPFGDTVEPVVVLHRIAGGILPNPRDVNPSVPTGVAALIARMMKKDPGERFSNWTTVIHHVRRLEKGGVTVAKPQVYENSAILPPTGDVPGGGEGAPEEDSPRRVAVPRRRTTTAAGKPARPGPRRLSLRKPAFLLLAAWLAYLAYHVFWPVSLVLPARLMPTRGAGPRGGERTGGGITREASSAWASRYGGRQGPDGVAYGPRAPRAPTAPELRELRTDVADALCAARFDAAMTLVEEDLALPHTDRAQAELGEIADIVEEVSAMDELIRAGARARLEEELTLRVHGRQQTLQLRAMAGDRLNAVVTTRRGFTVQTNDLTFTFADIHPSDLGILLGAANTPGRCTIKFLLCLQGRDYAKARMFAENCGPLAEALAAQADARRIFGE